MSCQYNINAKQNPGQHQISLHMPAHSNAGLVFLFKIKQNFYLAWEGDIVGLNPLEYHRLTSCIEWSLADEHVVNRNTKSPPRGGNNVGCGEVLPVDREAVGLVLDHLRSNVLGSAAEGVGGGPGEVHLLGLPASHLDSPWCTHQSLSVLHVPCP